MIKLRPWDISAMYQKLSGKKQRLEQLVDLNENPEGESRLMLLHLEAVEAQKQVLVFNSVPLEYPMTLMQGQLISDGKYYQIGITFESVNQEALNMLNKVRECFKQDELRPYDFGFYVLVNEEPEYSVRVMNSNTIELFLGDFGSPIRQITYEEQFAEDINRIVGIAENFLNVLYTKDCKDITHQLYLM